MKYTIGIQEFDKIRKEGYLYIDKTALIYKIVSEGAYYFLSRPRRFGKSLLISTLEAYFSGKKELFEGLAIAELEKEWNSYPILHLDLNAREYKEENSLQEELNRHLEKWEKLYGDEFKERATEERFLHVIEKAYEQTGKQVVILVDEYDKPLLQAINKPELQDAFRNKLKAFYAVLKTMDGMIKFAFLTGVTKFGKVSVFSDLNNLNDLSSDPRYTTLCGITEQEIRNQMGDEVVTLAKANGMTAEECYEELRRMYDGYHFRQNATGVYNPFSLLCCLEKKTFDSYWFETGTPTFLVEQLQKTEYNLEMLTQEELYSDALNSIDIMDRSPLPLLYQSGYLTIKEYDPVYKLYKLGFPNKEVEEGFVKFLYPYYTPEHKNTSAFVIRNFVQEIAKGEAEGFMRRLEAFLTDGNYQIAGDAELYFHNTLYVFFKLLGFYVDVERPTSDGRMDAVVQTKDYIYIFEFKINQSAEAALQQIEDKGYDKPFATDTRKLFKIGINFSTETRRISEWKMA